MAAEIANQLVRLANFQARCKLSQANARPKEHLIQMYDFPGIEDAELAQRLRERSSHQYGRVRADVERGIEERLRVKRKMENEEEAPILREKSQGKISTTNKPRRSPKKPTV